MTLIDTLRREAALGSTFSRAQSIARGHAIAGYSVQWGKLSHSIMLEGHVRGSDIDPYETFITFDEDGDELIDYGCSCPAAHRYSGLCKHGIALTLRYLGDIDRLPAYREPTKSSSGGIVRVPATTQQRTASEIFDAMGAFESAAEVQARTLLKGTRASSDCERGAQSFRIEAHVDSYYDPLFSSLFSWCVSLSLHRGSAARAALKVASIPALLRAQREHTPLHIGKSGGACLSFEGLDDKSLRILAVLQRAYARLEDMFVLHGEGELDRFGGSIPLSDTALIELIDCYKGETIAWGKRGKLRVREGMPRVSARIEKTFTGFDLILPSGWICLEDGNRCYLANQKCAWDCSDALEHGSMELLRPLLSKGVPLHIQAEDMPRFCKNLLKPLKETLDLRYPAELNDMVPEPHFTFKIWINDSSVACQTLVSYAEQSFEVFGDEKDDESHPVRDRIAEARALVAVVRYFPDGGALPCFDFKDDELLYDLLTEGLKTLSAQGEILMDKRLRSVAVRPVPRLDVGVRLNDGLLDVELGASGMKPHELEEFLAAYKPAQKFVRLKSGDIFRIDDAARAQLDSVDHLAVGLGSTPRDLARGLEQLPKNRSLFVKAMLARADGLGIETCENEAFTNFIGSFDELSCMRFSVPGSLEAALRGYQLDGYQWLRTLEHLGLGGILADDMGLGKTLQVITCILAGKEDGREAPTLVVCPASLVYNWISELNRFAPSLACTSVVGAKRQRDLLIAQASEYDVLVTSYDLLRRDIEAYEACAFRLLVLDEAQYIKNPLTKVAKAAAAISAECCFALTGTPVENRLSELWSIFNVAVPGLLGAYRPFVKRYANPGENEDVDAQHELRDLVAPFILRRLKSDVIDDLPEKTETVICSCLEGEQETLYRAVEDRLALQIARELPNEMKRHKLQVLAELTKLRQICCDPSLCFADYAGPSAKLDTCIELISNACDGGHRVLVFSQFASMFPSLARRLDRAKVSYVTLTGATSKLERAQRVERFQAGECDVFLISLKAGGVGLNLTRADIVIHFDPWWNVAAQNQATDRAYRIGQKRDVTVYKLIAKNTIEERILAMQERKRDLADAVLSGEGASSALISREDLLSLLGA